MVENNDNRPVKKGGIRGAVGRFLADVPILGLLLGMLAAVLLEQFVGLYLAKALGMSKIPVLFGFVTIAKSFAPMVLTPMQVYENPVLIWQWITVTLGALVYVTAIYILPIYLVGRLLAGAANAVASSLMRLPIIVTVLVHLALLYAVLHFWSDVSGYRALTLKLTLIAVMVTLSLNVINGYMGEFSCSHPGFMALGAYATSIFTVALFADDRIFGKALISTSVGPWIFPVALIIGGLVAALGAMIIAIPSFRTRGDYLAIISLAFLFIVKSLIENLEVVGGPRGLSSQPDWANLPTVFIWCVLCVWIINNFVRSTFGKATNAVRDDEGAAEAMTVNTRRTKMTAFMFAAFWAGVAGGLFAHVLRYVNPGTFSLQKLAEVLAMVYFGGLNSVYGSIVGAVSISVLGEALRPLEILKWILIPLLLILVMIYRPTGLIAFKEFDVRTILQPRRKREEV